MSQVIRSDYHVLASVAVGRGLRFNNPYRLSTELGGDAESVSLTATYLDLGLTSTLGSPDGVQHGASLHLSAALVGISQTVLSTGYCAMYRGPHSYVGYGRLGPAFVLTPDPTGGIEGALGFGYFVTGKLGITSEIVFDLFYGAGTPDVAIATYPILSLQLGLLFDQEFLP